MAKIKKFNIFDVVKVRKMISLLNTAEPPSFLRYFLLFPFDIIQNILPIKLKKLPESFVSIENKAVNGMISAQAERGNPYKWNIKELFLDKNSYAAGRQLVDYILAKYGAMGANTFCVVVDDSHEELIDLFSKGCGFRLCSHETVWKMNEITFSEPSLSGDNFRPFKNSDAAQVCELYNDLIYPHFRYSLARDKAEFHDRIFQGLSPVTCFKYVVDDLKTKRIKAYIEIQTTDNYNYILDIVVSQAYDDRLSDIVNFTVSQIVRRKKEFCLFIFNRKYMVNSKKYEEYLKEHKFSVLQNNMVLVKDFFKSIRQEEKISKPAIAFSEIKGKPAFSLPRDECV